MANHSNPLEQKLNDFRIQFDKIEHKQDDLLLLRDRLEKSLHTAAQQHKGQLAKQNSLTQLSEQLKKTIKASIRKWMHEWKERGTMRKLSDGYSDRVIILVFGKVNAGKSSFCNYVTSLFSEDDINRFRFVNGAIEYFEGEFVEGRTETTSKIQGVEIGSNLVLLDTPGLHSVTDANDALTRVFVDSADSILWLSHSQSPGQVQELDDLCKELENKKPLQPVITQSDVRNVDEDDSGNIVQCLVNKTPENRKAQQDDVEKRTREKLPDGVPLKSPLSISVHAYKQSGQTQKDMDEAGLTSLLEAIAELVDEGAGFKTEKASREVINYLKNSVLVPLKESVTDQLDDLNSALEKEQKTLRLHESAISTEVVSDVCLEVGKTVERFKESRDVEALSKAINELIEKRLNNVLRRELSGFTESLMKIESNLSAEEVGEYEDLTVDIEQVTGKPSKAISGTGGMLAGAALGGMLGPVGAIIGGVIGAFAGEAAGEALFVDTHIVKETVGVSTEKVTNSITSKVKENLPALVSSVIKELEKNLDDVREFNSSVRNAIERFESKVEDLRRV